ncbi:Pentatricopeptide repeat-containing protein 2 mitochondrial [Dissostichus eleginoides]|uniref:Pentatricopeptide repeat-containing protein 2 mitochondrial n=1 Tax=Dissostichus eleginoides TaxID=100907 RepID=A0AAD9B3Z6_DISEL|nr:Pentatricopeptide repeat-containing protein 2 mitochondrial [Dissostichus eleginoides]
MGLSSEGSIQWKETESHMGLRHEEERQGYQTEQTGSELEKGSEWTGSESIQREPPFVRAVSLNVNSLNKKTSIISEFITENHLDVLFLTETRLKLNTADDVLRDASPPNFSFFRHVSERTGRRGVAIQFSPVSHGRQIQFDNKETFECVVTVLKHDEWEEPVLSIDLYRPPPKTLITIRKFLKEFQELLNEFSQNYDNILGTGDFNIWVDCDKKKYVKEFKQLLSDNGFGMHPNEPTFHRSNHTLDLVLFRNVEVPHGEVWDHHISDHKPVQFDLRPVPRDKRKKQDEDRKRLKKG